MSKRVFLLGVGIALLGLGLAFTDWVLSLRPGVTEANVKRIRAGMTEREVETLLGKPHLQTPFDDLEDSDVWFVAGGYAIVVYCGKPRRVERAWFRWHHDRPGPLDRLRAWLGL
jgi:hypothetical protein